MTITEGVSEVTLEGATYHAPLVDYDLLQDFKLTEIVDSLDLIALLSSSFISLSHNGTAVTDPRDQLLSSLATRGASFPQYIGSFYQPDPQETSQESYSQLIPPQTLDLDGTYEVSLSFLWSSESTAYGIEVKVFVDGEEQIHMRKVNSRMRDYAVPASFRFPVVTSGATIDVEFRSQKNSKWVSVTNTYLRVDRLA